MTRLASRSRVTHRPRFGVWAAHNAPSEEHPEGILAPLPSTIPDNVLVTQQSTSVFRVEFQNALANQGFALMSVVATGMTVPTVTRFQAGGGGLNEMQDVTVPVTLPNLAFFRLTVNGAQTGAIQVSTNSGGLSANRIRIHLCALNTIGRGTFASGDNYVALQNWLNSLQTDDVGEFRAGQDYRCDWGLVLTTKTNVHIHGNGATLRAIASLADYDPSGSSVSRKQFELDHCTGSELHGLTIVSVSDGNYKQDAEQEAAIKVTSGSNNRIYGNIITGPMGDCVQVAGQNAADILNGLEVDTNTFNAWGRMLVSSGGFFENWDIHHNTLNGPGGRSMIDLEFTNQQAYCDVFKFHHHTDNVVKGDGTELLNWFAGGGLGKHRHVQLYNNTTRVIHVSAGTSGAKYTKLVTNGTGTFQLVVFDERQHVTMTGFGTGDSFKLSIPVAGTTQAFQDDAFQADAFQETGSASFESTTTVTFDANFDITRGLIDTAAGECFTAAMGTAAVAHRDNWTAAGGDIYMTTPTLTNVAQLSVSSPVGCSGVVTTMEQGGQTTESIDATLTDQALADAVLAALLGLDGLVPGQVAVEADPDEDPNTVFVDLGFASLDVEVPALGSNVASGCVVTLNAVDRFDYEVHDNIGTLPTHGTIMDLNGADTAEIHDNVQAWDGGAGIKVVYSNSINVGGALEHDNDTSPSGHWLDN